MKDAIVMDPSKSATSKELVVVSSHHLDSTDPILSIVVVLGDKDKTRTGGAADFDRF